MAPSAHPTRQPSRLRTMPLSVQLQDRTKLYLPIFLELALYVALVLTWWASTPSALRLAIELPHVRPRLDKASRKSKRPVAHLRSYFLSLLTGRKSSLHLPWLVAPRTLSILSVVWTVMANLMKLRRIRSRRLLDYSVTNCTSRILLDLSPYEPPKIWDRSVVIGHPAPHETCITCFSSWAHCWRPAHFLQWILHGSKISH